MGENFLSQLCRWKHLIRFMYSWGILVTELFFFQLLKLQRQNMTLSVHMKSVKLLRPLQKSPKAFDKSFMSHVAFFLSTIKSIWNFSFRLEHRVCTVSICWSILFSTVFSHGIAANHMKCIAFAVVINHMHWYDFQGQNSVHLGHKMTVN